MTATETRRRRKPEPVLHARRTCPACSRRYAGLVAPDCPVCQGIGTLTLGPPILNALPPQAAARAIELRLEQVARQTQATYPIGHPAHAETLEQTVRDLTYRGCLADPLLTPSAPVHDAAPSHHAVVRAIASGHRPEQVWDQLATNFDKIPGPEAARHIHALDAPPTIHGRDDRPHANGQLPRVSTNGSHSSMAQATDPWHPLETTTHELATQRQQWEHQAQAAARAATP